MKSYLTEKKLSMNFWIASINHCLLDYRNTPHSATKERPMDLFLGFKAKDYLPYKTQNVDKTVNVELKYKETSNAKFENRTFRTGSRVLVKQHFGSKFNVKSALL